MTRAIAPVDLGVLMATHVVVSRRRRHGARRRLSGRCGWATRSTLLEAAPEPGGMAAHFDLAGLSIERFYHFVCKSDQPTFELMRGTWHR